MIEPDMKTYREDVAEYYQQHFSDEEIDVVYEIIRGNVPVEAMREDLEKFFDDPDIPLVSFFDITTDEGMLERLEYDIGYVGGVGTRSVYQPN